MTLKELFLILFTSLLANCKNICFLSILKSIISIKKRFVFLEYIILLGKIQIKKIEIKIIENWPKFKLIQNI